MINLRTLIIAYTQHATQGRVGSVYIDNDKLCYLGSTIAYRLPNGKIYVVNYPFKGVMGEAIRQLRMFSKVKKLTGLKFHNLIKEHERATNLR